MISAVVAVRFRLVNIVPQTRRAGNKHAPAGREGMSSPSRAALLPHRTLSGRLRLRNRGRNDDLDQVELAVLDFDQSDRLVRDVRALLVGDLAGGALEALGLAERVPDRLAFGIAGAGDRVRHQIDAVEAERGEDGFRRVAVLL